MSRRRINVGCGEFPLPLPWENFDVVLVPPDPGWLNRLAHENPRQIAGEAKVGDALFIDYAGASTVYCGHMIEHLLPDEVRMFFRRVRLQAPQARLVITTPAWERLDGVDFEMLQGMGGGQGRWRGDRHRSWWRAQDLERELRAAGFKNVHEWEDCPWLVSRVPWQVCMEAS